MVSVIRICGNIYSFLSIKCSSVSICPFNENRVPSVPGGADGKPFVYTTTPRPPLLHYAVELKLVEVGENFEVPQPGTVSWRSITDRIKRSVEGAIQDIPGYQAAEVTKL